MIIIEIHSQLIRVQWNAEAFNWTECPSRGSDVKRTRVTSAGNDAATGCGADYVKTDKLRGKLLRPFESQATKNYRTCFPVYMYMYMSA